MADTAPPPPRRNAAPEGLIDLLQGLLADLPGLVSDRVELLALELQRASRSLAQIVALVVAAAILGVTAWLATWAGISAGLIALGLHWGWAMLLVVLANVIAAWAAIARVRALAPRLGLPATRRNLTVRPDKNPSQSASADADEHPAARTAG
jgi:hypothetical protein